MSSIRNAKRLSAIFVTVAAACLVLTSTARAAAPGWLPSFPMRAGGVVLVMWLPVPGATEYKLLRKIEGAGDFAEIYKGAAPNFNDTAAADTTKTYVYKIVPIVGGKDGDPSPEGVVRGQEKIKPPEIGGTLVTADGIQVRWGLAAGAAFYNIYRAEGKEANFKLLKSLQETQYFDRDVKQGNSYFYQVSAVDKMSLESEMSKTARADVAKAAAVVVKKKVVQKKVKKLGEYEGEKFYELERPGSMAVGPGGELFVAEVSGIQVLDHKGEFQRRIKYPGWSEQFGLIATKDGTLLMAFPYESLVREISREDGKLINAYKIVPPKDLPETQMTRPGSCAVDGEGNVWVSDSTVGQIVIFDRKSAKEIGRVGMLRQDIVKLKEFPADGFPGLGPIAYNPYDDKIYAILSTDAQIKVIDAKTRKVVATLGGLGADVDQFSGIGGFGFRKNGNILVFDNLMAVVKEFTPKFEYVQSYGDVEKQNRVMISITASGWMTFNEKQDELYFVSKMGGRAFQYEIEK